MPKHLAGGKINRSHTTVIDAAVKVIALAESIPEVSKISLGKITAGLPAGIHRIKCLAINGGLRVEVRGTSSKQQLFIYSSDPVHTSQLLVENFR